MGWELVSIVSDQYPWLLHHTCNSVVSQSVSSHFTFSQSVRQSVSQSVLFTIPTHNNTNTVQHHMSLRRRLSDCHNFLPVAGLREKTHT